jgi:hypothetical protein
MSIIRNHLTKIVDLDFLLKYNVGNTKKLPKLKKIILSAKLSTNYKASIAVLIGILTFIKPCITISQKNVLSISLRKGDPVGIKTILRQKSIENFFLIFLFEILPSTKKLSPLKFHKQSLHWQIKDVFEYEETSDIYIYISEVHTLDIVINGINLNSNFFAALRLPVNKN